MLNYFAKNISYLRKIRKLSQEDMATGIGVQRSTWSNYENGRTEPNFETMMSIIKFFDVSADTILGTDIEKSKSTEQKATATTLTTATRPANSLSYMQESRPSQFMEDPVAYETALWLVLQELRRNTEKLDQLSKAIAKQKR